MRCCRTWCLLASCTKVVGSNSSTGQRVLMTKQVTEHWERWVHINSNRSPTEIWDPRTVIDTVSSVRTSPSTERSEQNLMDIGTYQCVACKCNFSACELRIVSLTTSQKSCLVPRTLCSKHHRCYHSRVILRSNVLFLCYETLPKVSYPPTAKMLLDAQFLVKGPSIDDIS